MTPSCDKIPIDEPYGFYLKTVDLFAYKLNAIIRKLLRRLLYGQTRISEQGVHKQLSKLGNWVIRGFSTFLSPSTALHFTTDKRKT